MENPTLVIGNKRYSSWSLRPWLVLRRAGIRFEEIRIPLYREDSAAALRRYSPTGKVPLLIDGDRKVWESLAICEYVAECSPEAGLWPKLASTRALARAVASEMHAGFAALRSEFPMNVRGPRTGVLPSPEARADIDRIVEIWKDCRDRFSDAGPWLFGEYSIADAMFAPVVIRFSTFCVAVPESAQQYMATVLADSHLREWIDAGLAESEIIPGSERGRLIE